MPKGEAMQSWTVSAAPCVFPRGDFLWSPTMKMRPGERERMSNRAPRVFQCRGFVWSSSWARVVGHVTVDGKKMTATPCTLSYREKRMFPPATKKGPAVVDSQNEEAAAPHTSGCVTRFVRFILIVLVDFTYVATITT